MKPTLTGSACLGSGLFPTVSVMVTTDIALHVEFREDDRLDLFYLMAHA